NVTCTGCRRLCTSRTRCGTPGLAATRFRPAPLRAPPHRGGCTCSTTAASSSCFGALDAVREDLTAVAAFAVTAFVPIVAFVAVLVNAAITSPPASPARAIAPTVSRRS
ncbi:MAG: hypothetical protein QOI41_7597, partial [Myxococcales bacterium]|nr:hypothetical protein [Myxococcales bacterium]